MPQQYEQVYQRNIGLFTADQQEKLRRAKVTVAGVGGVGGYQAVALARQGIGELAIIDPGVFDPPDMNRQYGAMASTIGRNKAEVTAELLRDINPHMRVRVVARCIDDVEEMRAFMVGSALVVDAIDYAGFNHKQLFHQCAREQGMPILSGPIPGFGATLMVFAPHGMTVEEFYSAPAERAAWPGHMLPIDRLLPASLIPPPLAAFAAGEAPYLTSNGAAAQLAGGLIGLEAALMIAGLRTLAEQVVVPEVLYLDAVHYACIRFNPLTRTEVSHAR